MTTITVDEIRAIAETHRNLLDKNASVDEKLLELERRMAEGAHTGQPDGSGSNKDLRQAADKLMRSEAVQAVLKGHSKQAGFDIPASVLNL